MNRFETETKTMLGELIRYHRRHVKNISLEKLGELVGIDANNLGRIERGEQIAELITFYKLVCTLDMESDYHDKIKELCKSEIKRNSL